MKTLVNKNNPQIRITAPEITIAHPPLSNEGYVYWIPAINQMYNPIDWTLVEEEPEKINFYQIVHQSYEDKVKMYMTTTKKELAEMMARRDCIEDALQQQRTLDISQEPVTRMVGEQGALEIEKVNCPFDKGDCRYCTVQFCGAREENHIETRSTAEPVDLEKEYKEYVEDDPVFSKLTNRYAGLGIARHFYELGQIAQIEQNKALAAQVVKLSKEKVGRK